MTVDQIRSTRGFSQQTWLRTPHGEMTIYSRAPVDNDGLYISFIKSIIGDTLEFHWELTLLQTLTVEQIAADAREKFSSYGMPYVTKSSSSEPSGATYEHVYLVYGCENCDELEAPYCQMSKLVFELCIIARRYGEERRLSGYWHNADAYVAQGEWIEQMREKVEF
ncbi:hypothetical protein [Mesorhizobium sp. CAU 1741]|uniref:hypothetical protein n=1 Tax=Mesorhizobium sp. CAU 1741 TaxID=3140366 RepID=UPI00325B62D2